MSLRSRLRRRGYILVKAKYMIRNTHLMKENSMRARALHETRKALELERAENSRLQDEVMALDATIQGWKLVAGKLAEQNIGIGLANKGARDEQEQAGHG